MPTPSRPTPGLHAERVVEVLSNYLEKLVSGAGRASEHVKDRVAERMADRVADKVVDRIADLDARVATLEILDDEEALADLRASQNESESDLRDYDEIRRDSGLA